MKCEPNSTNPSQEQRIEPEILTCECGNIAELSTSTRNSVERDENSGKINSLRPSTLDNKLCMIQNQLLLKNLPTPTGPGLSSHVQDFSTVAFCSKGFESIYTMPKNVPGLL